MTDTNQIAAKSLTSGRVLGRNAFWNLGGSLAPLVAAALTIPYIITTLGTERFGLLTLVWALIGYFSFFDLGLGQAITKRVSEGVERDSPTELAETVWTALTLMLCLSIVAGLLVWAMTPWLVDKLLNIPIALQPEFRHSLWLIALSMPVVVTTAGLRGILEAYQKFRLINLIRIPMGMFVFLSPLLVLPFEINLVPLVALLIIGRLVAWFVYCRAVWNLLPALRTCLSVKMSEVGNLLSFGSWMTLSNLILPIMVYFDRFVIGSILTLAAISYYVTSHEVVTRLRIIPTALGGVIFPAFSRAFSTETSTRVEKLFGQSQNAIFLGVFLPVLFISLFAHEGLTLWLDAEFAEQSTTVVRWLAIGVFVNAMGAVSVNLIRAIGRPDLTAKVYLIELPIFFLMLIKLVEVYGINGAAFAYFFRWLIDTAVMLYLSVKLYPPIKADCIKTCILVSCGSLILLGITFVNGVIYKAVVLTAVTIVLLWAFRQTIMQWKSLLK